MGDARLVGIPRRVIDGLKPDPASRFEWIAFADFHTARGPPDRPGKATFVGVTGQRLPIQARNGCHAQGRLAGWARCQAFGVRFQQDACLLAIN